MRAPLHTGTDDASTSRPSDATRRRGRRSIQRTPAGTRACLRCAERNGGSTVRTAQPFPRPAIGMPEPGGLRVCHGAGTSPDPPPMGTDTRLTSLPGPLPQPGEQRPRTGSATFPRPPRPTRPHLALGIAGRAAHGRRRRRRRWQPREAVLTRRRRCVSAGCRTHAAPGCCVYCDRRVGPPGAHGVLHT